ncbi:hypothetical protein FRB90_007172 [Tulasnella sp. 427]|nr:hypothetical protein FRB90_007172 [Tulasnella sp. 427]
MVSFQCDGCGDVIKKPKLDSHSCKSSFTCLDCNKTFHTPADWKPHTTCISEDQKYQKSVYKPKQPQQRNNANQRGGWNQFDADPNAAANQSPNANGPPQNERPTYGASNGYSRNRGQNNRPYGTRGPPPPRNLSTGVNSIPMKSTRAWGSNAPSPSASSPPPAEEQNGAKRKFDETAAAQSESARESKRSKHFGKSEVEQTSNPDSTVVESGSDSRERKEKKKDKSDKKERKEKKEKKEKKYPMEDAMDVDTAVEELSESPSKKEKKDKKDKKDKKRKDKSGDITGSDNDNTLSAKMEEKKTKKEKKRKERTETAKPDEAILLDQADVEPKRSKKDKGTAEEKERKKAKKEKKERKEKEERKEQAVVEV